MRTALTFLATPFLASCAAIVAPKTFDIPIDSVPPGAIVTYREANVGITPCTVKMHRSCSRVVLRHDGFHDQWIEVGTGTSAWIIGNVVFGGLIGLIVDLAGGAKTLNDRPCCVELTPVRDPLPAVWERTPEPTIAAEEDGWVREGEVRAPVAAKPERRATRAAALPSNASLPSATKPTPVEPPDGKL